MEVWRLDRSHEENFIKLWTMGSILHWCDLRKRSKWRCNRGAARRCNKLLEFKTLEQKNMQLYKNVHRKCYDNSSWPQTSFFVIIWWKFKHHSWISVDNLYFACLCSFASFVKGLIFMFGWYVICFHV